MLNPTISSTLSKHSSESREEGLEVLVFALDDERFAIPIEGIRELTLMVAVTPLPNAPKFIEGVIGYRGEVIPVFSIRERFGLRPAPISHKEHLIVARAGNRTVALRVNRAIDVLRTPLSSIHEATNVTGDMLVIKGVVRLSDGLVLIANLEDFLSQEESSALSLAMSLYVKKGNGP